MIEVIKQKESFLHSKQKLQKLIIYYVIFSLILLSLITTFFLMSTENYLILLIVNIALTISLFWGSIYLFTNPFKTALSYYKFFKDLNDGSLSQSYVLFKEHKLEKILKQDLEYFVIVVNEKNNDNLYEREVYSLYQLDDFPLNKLVKIETFGNVLIKYEEIK